MTGYGDSAVYSEEVVDAGSKVMPDMVVDPSGHFLYILTENRVSVLEIRCRYGDYGNDSQPDSRCHEIVLGRISGVTNLYLHFY